MKPANLSNWILLVVKYDSAPSPPLIVLSCRMWLSSWVSPPFECHPNHSVTNGHERPWRTAKARVFEMSNLCLQREEAGDPCSSSLSFRVLSREAACSCPRLFTAGGIHTGRRGTKPSVFEQQVVIQSRCLLYVHFFAQGEFRAGLRHIFIIDLLLL